MKAIADNARWKGLCPQTVNTVKEAAPARATDLLQSPSKAVSYTPLDAADE